MNISLITDTLGDYNLFREKIETIIEDQDYKTYNISELNVTPCDGCRECQKKTPGKCKFDDDGDDVVNAAFESDVIIILSGISFGCFSPNTKDFLERCYILLKPELRQSKVFKYTETFYGLRQKNRPQLIVIGYGDHLGYDEQEVFYSMVERNAIALNIRGFSTFICQTPEDLLAAFARVREVTR